MKNISLWRLKMSNNLKYYGNDKATRASDLLFLLHCFNMKSINAQLEKIGQEFITSFR